MQLRHSHTALALQHLSRLSNTRPLQNALVANRRPNTLRRWGAPSNELYLLTRLERGLLPVHDVRQWCIHPPGQ